MIPARPHLRVAATLATLLLGACNPIKEDTLDGHNAVPVALPGPSLTVPRSVQVRLDGNRSYDPEGKPLSFAWSFVSRPSDSRALLSAWTTAQPTYTPDVKGEYHVQLVVSDGMNKSEPATLTLTVPNTPPQAHADTALATVVGAALLIPGRGSDDDGDPLTYSWTLTQRPTGSTTTLTGADTPTPTFIPDVEGDYLFSFVVHDGHDASTAVSVTVTAHRPIHLLGHRVIDAEYSKALDRLVMVSDNPNALYLYDPETRTETSVTLPKPPTSVSVGPDGRFAAVGHDSLISYVDLTTPTLLKTLPVSTGVVDIILAGNGYAYAFPSAGSSSHIRSVQLSTGMVTLSSDWIFNAGTLVRLHPQGTDLYGADHDAIERYDITQGTARVLYQSAYDSEHPVCGDDLWLSEDGGRIFTRCGNTFRTSNIQSKDMLYAGSLPGISLIQHLSHSIAANRVALIPTRKWYDPPAPVDTQVKLFTPDFLVFDRSVSLPPFMMDGKAYAGHGRFVFFNAAGDKMMVILQADPESAMLNDYGIVTY